MFTIVKYFIVFRLKYLLTKYLGILFNYNLIIGNCYQLFMVHIDTLSDNSTKW